jgi:hypothetical protein
MPKCVHREPDGSIDEDEQGILDELAAWMKTSRPSPMRSTPIGSRRQQA